MVETVALEDVLLRILCSSRVTTVPLMLYSHLHINTYSYLKDERAKHVKLSCVQTELFVHLDILLHVYN